MATATATRPTAATKKIATKVANRLTGTLGSDIDNMYQLREDKRMAELKVKEFDAKISEAEQSIMERLEASGLDSAKGKSASVSITTATVANVEDWEAFHAYIGKNKFFHLLQKRVSEPAYRELLDMGKKVPGVTPFNKKKLNLRSISV